MKKLWLGFVSAVLFAVSFQAVAGDDITVTMFQNADSSITEGESKGYVRANIEKVWAALINYDHIIDWMPNCKESRFDRTEEGNIDYAYLRMGISLYGERDMFMKYTRKIETPNMKRLEGERMDGSWDYMKGFTVLKKVDDTTTLMLTHWAGRSGIDLPQAINVIVTKDQLRQYLVNMRKLLE